MGHRDPGNFNYHLDQLVGRLVVKEEKGYRLSHFWLQLVGAVTTRRYERSGEDLLPDLDATCVFCDNTATASYDDGVFSPGCSDHTFRIDVPKAAIERHTGESLGAFVSLLTQQKIQLAVREICPLCYGYMPSGIDTTDGNGYAHWFRGTCEHCGAHIQHTVGGCVVSHPAVVSFLYEHGTDLRSTPDC